MSTTESMAPVGDAERNRLLRRADWRFLLPCPAPRLSVCFTDGPLAEATAAISHLALRAGDTCPPARGCDLAVAADPPAETLRRAWEALRPGGTLYVEWYRGLPCPAGVRRRLETAGFEEVTSYAPRPGPDLGAEVWVPLGGDQAVRFFLTDLSRRRSGLRGLMQRLRGVAWRSGWRFRWSLPLCTVARRAAETPSAARAIGPGLPRQLREEILSNWESWDLGPPPRDLSVLLVTRGRRSINKAVALVFERSNPNPRLALKRARVPGAVPGMYNEAEVLRVVQARPGGMRGAPRVLFCRELDGFLTLAETFVAGRPMTEILAAGTCGKLALQATDWSADLALAGQAVSPDVWWGRLVEPTIADFERNFGPVLDQAALRDCLALLSSLGPLPLVCEQRDFAPWNLLLSPRGELGVLDWESAERQGLPALDLVYGLTYISAFVDGSIHSGHLWQAWRRCRSPGTEMGSIAQECLERYFHRTGTPAAALRPLALLAWMIHSRSDYRHLCLDLGQSPGAAALRESKFLRLWQEELGAETAG